MSSHFADRLMRAIKEKGVPVCVGLDPVYDRLPAAITEREGFNDPSNTECAVDAVSEFCRQVIKSVAPIVPAVKINSAFFERFYSTGMEAYYDLVEEARSRGLIVIGDVKRADVGYSAVRYAKAHLADPELAGTDELMIPDAVTVNAYLGLDGVKPFIDVARSDGKGVFVLVQTSNETAAEIQGVKLADGGTLAEYVAQKVDDWAGDHGLMGTCGYSAVGAVVSPQNAQGTARLRDLMPRSIFLVPGFGAQGLKAEDAAACFKADGTGALVTASRSVIYAYEETKYLEMYASEWEKCVEHACRDFAKSVVAATSL